MTFEEFEKSREKLQKKISKCDTGIASVTILPVLITLLSLTLPTPTNSSNGIYSFFYKFYCLIITILYIGILVFCLVKRNKYKQQLDYLQNQYISIQIEKEVASKLSEEQARLVAIETLYKDFTVCLYDKASTIHNACRLICTSIVNTLGICKIKMASSVYELSGEHIGILGHYSNTGDIIPQLYLAEHKHKVTEEKYKDFFVVKTLQGQLEEINVLFNNQEIQSKFHFNKKNNKKRYSQYCNILINPDNFNSALALEIICYDKTQIVRKKVASLIKFKELLMPYVNLIMFCKSHFNSEEKQDEKTD